MVNPLTKGRMMNVARAIDMEFWNKNKGWHGKDEMRTGGNSSYKVGSNIPGRIIPKTQGTGGGINGPGPNTTKELGEGASPCNSNDFSCIPKIYLNSVFAHD